MLETDLNKSNDFRPHTITCIFRLLFRLFPTGSNIQHPFPISEVNWNFFVPWLCEKARGREGMVEEVVTNIVNLYQHHSLVDGRLNCGGQIHDRVN